ncbi:MAG: hypothetical protein O2954_11825 [bacterium]|nr:hypothetical protein [bacterium]
MQAPHLTLKDARLINNGTEQSVAVEFGDGKVRTFTAKQLYELSRMAGTSSPEPDNRTASQRRAEELLNMRRGRR